MILLVGKPLISPHESVFKRNRSWPRACFNEPICASLPICWVVGYTVYGHSTDLRDFLRNALGLSFALAVPHHEVVCVDTVLADRLGEGRLHRYLLPDGTLLWQRFSMSQGTKGERLFDWAIVPQVHRTIVDGMPAFGHPPVPRRSFPKSLLLCLRSASDQSADDGSGHWSTLVHEVDARKCKRSWTYDQ